MLARDCTIRSLVSCRCISAVASFPRSQEVRSESAMRSCAASELDVIPVVDRRASAASLVAVLTFERWSCPSPGLLSDGDARRSRTFVARLCAFSSWNGWNEFVSGAALVVISTAVVIFLFVESKSSSIKEPQLEPFFSGRKRKTRSSSDQDAWRGPPWQPSSVSLTDCSHLDQIWTWGCVEW